MNTKDFLIKCILLLTDRVTKRDLEMCSREHLEEIYHHYFDEFNGVKS